MAPNPKTRTELETAAAAGLSELSGLAIGIGVGMLVADRFRRGGRNAIALGLFAVGVVSTLPFLLDFLGGRLQQLGSDRSMRRRLASIRQAGCMQSESEFY